MDCDIIIPVWNQRAFTEDCVNSIRKNTKGSSYRLIVIDNASDAQTRSYLEELNKSQDPNILLIRNEKNIGFIKAVNQGMKASSAPYLCILNNDTIVEDGWLKMMMDVAAANKDVGIVNPSSNNLGQRPESGEPIEHYALRLAKEAGRFVELGSAIGFCMLIKREVVDKVGVFDEIYGMGNFEDTDFCRRAIKAGYKCVRSCGSYVYHRENTSFKKVKTFNEDFERNKEIYETRWGRPKRVAYILDTFDPNLLKKLEVESVRLARGGNWVWYFSKERVNIYDHSNIIRIEMPEKNFHFKALFKILKKKKKFDEIYVQEERLGRIVEALAFIHKAKVGYF